MGALLLSFLAGSLTTLSPCVLPILPIVLLGALDQHRFGPLALAGGMVASFLLLALAVYGAGSTLDLSSDTVRNAGAVLLLFFGALLLSAKLKAGFANAGATWAAPLNRLLERITPSGLQGQFLLGALLGAVWSPCSGPTLGSALTLAAQSDTLPRAAIIMLFFGAGATAPMLVLAYGSRQTLKSRRALFAKLGRIAMPVMGAVLVAAGVFVLSGLDRVVETAVTNAMPEWLVTLTTRY